MVLQSAPFRQYAYGLVVCMRSWQYAGNPGGAHAYPRGVSPWLMPMCLHVRSRRPNRWCPHTLPHRARISKPLMPMCLHTEADSQHHARRMRSADSGRLPVAHASQRPEIHCGIPNAGGRH
eukprot:362590-Chlamydomonas_euryale.AAC.1